MYKSSIVITLKCFGGKKSIVQSLRIFLTVLHGGIILPPRCKINYVNTQQKYVNILIIYVDLQRNHVNI